MKADPNVSTLIIRLHACTETRTKTLARTQMKRSRGMRRSKYHYDTRVCSCGTNYLKRPRTYFHTAKPRGDVRWLLTGPQAPALMKVPNEKNQAAKSNRARRPHEANCERINRVHGAYTDTAQVNETSEPT